MTLEEQKFRFLLSLCTFVVRMRLEDFKSSNVAGCFSKVSYEKRRVRAKRTEGVEADRRVNSVGGLA